MCQKCAEIVTAEIQYNPNEIVAIESGTFLSKPDQETKQAAIQPTELAKIQSSFVYGQYKYQLKGIVNYLPANNHFIVHVLRNNIWRTYDDLKHVYKPKIDFNSIRPSALFYLRTNGPTKDQALTTPDLDNSISMY